MSALVEVGGIVLFVVVLTAGIAYLADLPPAKALGVVVLWIAVAALLVLWSPFHPHGCTAVDWGRATVCGAL